MKRMSKSDLCKMPIGTFAVISSPDVSDEVLYYGLDGNEARRIAEIPILDARTLYCMSKDYLMVWCRDHWNDDSERVIVRQQDRIADAVLDLVQCPSIDQEPMLSKCLVDLADAIRTN